MAAAVDGAATQSATCTRTHVAIIASWQHLPMRARLAIVMTDEALYALCAANPDLRIEREADGELIFMPPTGGETGARNARITAQLVSWADRDGTGIAFDSSAGFVLPNGAERAPDAAWIANERWLALSDEQRRKLVPLCPDFVVELMFPSDELREQQVKLEEYIANGARLGWLLDTHDRRAHVYRPGRPGPQRSSTLPARLAAARSWLHPRPRTNLVSARRPDAKPVRLGATAPRSA